MDGGFDIGRDLLCTTDAEGRFASLNAAWETVLGWSREELMSKPFIEFVHPDDLERTAAEAAKVAQPDYEVADFSNRYRTKAGDYRWLRWSARSDGEVWFAVAHDVTEPMETEARLREAFTDERLLAYSQRIVDQRTRGLAQEELLVRLLDDGAVLPPAAFVPDAERVGVIGIVDRWMTLQGVRLARQGRSVEINLSAQSLADEQLADELEEELRGEGGTARRLIFEITETAAVADFEAARAYAERLRKLGCRFALDDFGTGFGSLTYLRQLPVQILKIDSSFVRGMSDSADDRAMVRSVAAIARELGLKTVAEGVEDSTALNLLCDYGIDQLQGFLIGRPEPVVNGSPQPAD